jgi:hypothetical protein
MTAATLKTAGVLAGLAMLAWIGFSPTVAAAKATEADLAKVKIGMDRATVLEIMGRPDKDQPVREEEELCRLYVYRNVGRYKIVNIWFDCQDKVQAIDKVG